MSASAVHKLDNNATRQTRLAIAGIGLVGLRHAEAIAQLNQAVLVAVVDPSPQGQEAAGTLGVPCFSDLSEMLAAENPDGVIISTPTRLHVEQALTCIRAGTPVMVEKPLATSVEDAMELVAEARAAEVPLLVGHHRRHNPIIRKAHSLIQDGSIGKVRALQVTCWFYKPDGYFDTAPWRKLKGAGPISVNLVHDVDLMRHFCGEVISVQAQAAPSERGFENEDVASAVLKFDTGAIATVSVSDGVVAPWSWEMTSKEYPVYPNAPESCYLIGGSHGSLSIPDLRLWTHKEERDWWSPISAASMPCERTDPLLNQIEHLVEVIAGTAEPLVSGEEGLRTLRVIEAIQTAALSGETVHLPLPEEDN